jgi:hypothetical protein
VSSNLTLATWNNAPAEVRFLFGGKLKFDDKIPGGGLMTIPDSLLQILTYDGTGYQPLVDYQSWRVALMNYTPDLVPEKISQMQKHNETDEVFVLLAGRCILFLGEGMEEVICVHAVDMQPFKLYNVRRGVWHSHTFSPDARVLIVENRDTTDVNSPFIALTAEQKTQIIEWTRRLWGEAQETS